MSGDRIVLAGRLAGERYVVLADGAASSGAFAAVEIVAMPGGGAPLHRHRLEDELFHIVGGALELMVGDVQITAATGDSAFVPRGTAHAFRTLGDAPARVVAVYTPAGPEGWFRAAFEPLGTGGHGPAAVTLARMRAAGARFGIEWLDEAG